MIPKVARSFDHDKLLVIIKIPFSPRLFVILIITNCELICDIGKIYIVN